MKASELIRKAFASLSKTFRGEIWDDALTYKLHGKAYEAVPVEQNQRFWIKSARHLTGPLRALKDPEVRIVFIIGATQCLKTIAGDIWTIYVMVHAPRNMLVLFEVVDKAKLFCNVRLMEVIKKHPVLKKQIAEADRHDVNKTYIKLAGMDLKADGLNDRSLSTLSWPYIRVSEAWQTGKNGMLKKAFKRADRFPDNCKILCESQAGLTGEDLHTESSAAHQVPLTWACPHCGGRQSWECAHEFGNLRDENFVAIRPKDAPDNWEAPKPGTYSGMKFAGEGTIDERARTAAWECHWCGIPIADGKKNRMAIMDSYEQEYRIKQPDGTWKTPKQVCFVLPRESMWDNTFESAVKSYLTAKAAASKSNFQLIADWYMSERAVFYGGQGSERRSEAAPSSYDPARYKELMGDDFHSVNMIVDCQMDMDHKARTGASITGWFWYIVRAVDKFSNSMQLARGFCKSWEAWIAVQKHFGIPNDRVMIDGIFDGEGVLKKAIECREIRKRDKPHWLTKKLEEEVTWKLLIADKRQTNYKHPDKNLRPFSPESRSGGYVLDERGKPRWVEVPKIFINKDPVRFQVDALYSRAAGMPKFDCLRRDQLLLPDGSPDTVTLAEETGKRTYESQMQAQRYDLEKNKYVEEHPDDHYLYCEQGFVVRAGMDGLMGSETIYQETENKT